MRAADIIQEIIRTKKPLMQKAQTFAPTNIALIKYWGKRDEELNLPHTSSFSITLPNLGTTTTLSVHDGKEHIVLLNKKEVSHNNQFYKRLMTFIDLFHLSEKFLIETSSNIPIAAGLASSASGFAACMEALCALYGWALENWQKSIVARLGSGSACRSFWSGFVEWNGGIRQDGMDSFAGPFPYTFKDLCIGILLIDSQEKDISSRNGMQLSVTTSPFYKAWCKLVPKHLKDIKQAIVTHDFDRLGQIAEHNATSMHALTLSAYPSFLFAKNKTLKAIEDIRILRLKGLPLFFTQDGGPNLKLIYLQQDKEKVKEAFPELIHVEPFS